ncbi:MAG: type 4a pilus biogenesis protein PilO [Deltaproteobacteria bacterium]|nr:type 4a pilus biogenesis protein PilO [Deltaproteobacteria bacterium]
MKELLNRILALPRQQRIGILAGLVIALLVLDYFFLYSPQSVKIAHLRENIENVQKERDKKRKLTANLPRLEQQLKELDGILKMAVAQLPDRKEIPDLLSSVSSNARQAGLEILIFRPRGENYQEFYAEIPVDIVVRGGFHELVTFFDEVGRLNRLVNMHNIEMRNAKAQGDRISMDVSALATTYRFLDEKERSRVAAEKAAKAAKAKR